ncbi:lysozyme family protein [Peribacillus simplex]|uniref:lysozyme family protein n=1 Tax=Peribacillus simplex TaxID=1478 RepID=UPI0036702AA3
MQPYNFDTGFIDYAKARGGYSKEIAQSFSNMMAAKVGWSRYGDINYVDKVLCYYTGAKYGVSAAEIGSRKLECNGICSTTRY